MPLEQWLAFAAASAVMLAIPGPTILLVVSYALGHGRKAAKASVAGVALGDFTAMTASMLGLGALLAASAGLFTALKWIGAAYLIYLGVKLWRAPVSGGEAVAEREAAQESSLKIFAHLYLVTALNPKSLLFFMAFLPQFLNPAAPLWPQLLIFEATFLCLATLNALLYALAAAKARGSIRKPGVQLAANRIGGSLLIGAGVLAAGWRRGAP
ncbi:LysE family translocator [Neomegalonema perideroedes]|uniref:LysE family translocator n=1 Tax=Neomegalonema perideroedes TaxID=217219 RepID=UPI00036B15B5|nr:LysE family translocator [Neomegalonema perideroedes]